VTLAAVVSTFTPTVTVRLHVKGTSKDY